jgi:hypothetical protein
MTFVIEFMSEQTLSSQIFVLKKFEDSVAVIDADEALDGLETLQENDDHETTCPGAPRKTRT